MGVMALHNGRQGTTVNKLLSILLVLVIAPFAALSASADFLPEAQAIGIFHPGDDDHGHDDDADDGDDAEGGDEEGEDDSEG